MTVVEGGTDMNAAMDAIADDLAGEGRRGYVIPGGGSNPLGALGYVACAEEILAQSFDMGLELDHIVCASGSAGTHAGLLVGLLGCNAQLPLTGINVRRPSAEQEGNVYALAERTAALLELPPVPLLAKLEGVLLDPVYTGKAMAGLIGLTREGAFKPGERVLFVHTGGSPALYAYQDVLRSA